jgi:hypothetical protein
LEDGPERLPLFSVLASAEKGWMSRMQIFSEGELIYEAHIQFTQVIQYGVSMDDLSLGKAEIPPEGARFDQVFEGELVGPRLHGRMSGIDYLYVRADGLFQLHLHARVTTEDGANIAFSSQGVSRQIEGEREAQLRAAVSLFTSFEGYRWLNRLQLWALGTLDPLEGRAFVKAYAY